MAEILIKKGKKYNIFDKINNVWNQLSIWTHSDDVEFDDGKTASTKVGAINGISSSSTATDENIAASIGYVNQELTELNTNLTADGLQFKFSTDGEGNYGFLGADGSLIPFRNFSVLNDYKIIAIRAYDNNYTMNLSNTPDIIIVLPTGAYRTSNVDCNAEFGVIDKVGQSVIIGEVSYPTNKTTVTWTSDKVINITRTNINGGYTVIALKNP